MTTRSSGRDQRIRQHIALEAARILSTAGERDYHQAKRKAAAHLGAHATRNMPGNREIEQALVEYQRLFQGDSQPAVLHRLRQVALEAMVFFGAFSPRLAGPVLNGTADTHSGVHLHVFSATAEDVDLFLSQRHIPCREGVARLHMGPALFITYPSYRFIADDTPVTLIVFPHGGQRQAPLSPIDGRPMQRIGVCALRRLVEESTPP